MRVCTKCRRDLAIDAFGKDRNRPDGTYPICRECERARLASWRKTNADRKKRESREYYANNRDKVLARTKAYNYEHKDEIRFRKYGLTREAYFEMFERQGGRCAICGGVSTWRELDIDHCHASGMVRGLLCHFCNKTLGFVNDNPTVLRAAAQYLDNFTGKS